MVQKLEPIQLVVIHIHTQHQLILKPLIVEAMLQQQQQ
jgi:hypothetical protein